MNEELKIYLSTIYGEAATSSVASWKAIASVIENRITNKREWKKFNTVRRIIEFTGFDAFTQRNMPYKKAFEYFGQYPKPAKVNLHLKHLYEAVAPIYFEEEKPVADIVLYYSPKAMIILHQKNPKLYTRVVPKWDYSKLIEVKVPGCKDDDFIFFKYK